MWLKLWNDYDWYELWRWIFAEQWNSYLHNSIMQVQRRTNEFECKIIVGEIIPMFDYLKSQSNWAALSTTSNYYNSSLWCCFAFLKLSKDLPFFNSKRNYRVPHTRNLVSVCNSYNFHDAQITWIVQSLNPSWISKHKNHPITQQICRGPDQRIDEHCSFNMFRTWRK